MSIEDLQSNIATQKVSRRRRLHLSISKYVFKPVARILAAANLSVATLLTSSLFHTSMTLGAGGSLSAVGITSPIIITSELLFLTPIPLAGLAASLGVSHLVAKEIKRHKNERKLIALSINQLFSELPNFSMIIAEPHKYLNKVEGRTIYNEIDDITPEDNKKIR